MELEWSATITEVSEKDGKFLVLLDKSNFYPGGGGQPCDTGILESSGFSAKVIGAEKKDGKNFLVVGRKLEKGVQVTALVDRERRMLYTRTHTGEHILFKAIQMQAPDLKLKKMEIQEDGLCVIEAGGDVLTWERLRKAEELANNIIAEKRTVKEEWISKQDLDKHPELRIRPERIEGDAVRVITVDGFDTSACAGTHCTNTSEINGVVILNFNQSGPGSYRVGFRADFSNAKTQEELRKFAVSSRESSSLLSVGIEQLPVAVKNLLEEKERLKLQVRELGKGVQAVEESVNGIRFVSKIIEGFDRKQLNDLGASLLKDKTVVCLVNKGESSQIIIFVSKDLALSANELLKSVLEKFGGKGGGGKEFASGGVAGGREGKVVEFAKSAISNQSAGQS